MTFEDATLIRLADPATRAGVFDQTALEQFINAAYDTSLTPVDGPFSTVFDELRLGVPVLPVSTVEGSWGSLAASDRSMGTFQVAGMSGAPLAVDAFWRGFLVARTGAPSGTIIDVSTHWPSPDDVDDEIVSALGALPADPVVLEQERRTRFLTRLKNGVSNAEAVSSAVFDAMLRRVGAASVSDLFERHRGVDVAGSVTVTLQETAVPPPSPKALPVAAAILVRGAAIALAKLLVDSRLIRERLEAEGMSRPEERQFRVRHNVLVIWVVHEALFDDDGWPGAGPGDSAAVRRIKRRTLAGQWLAREGIGLAVVPA